MRRLAQEGIIRIIPGHTILVSAPTFQEALDLVDVRMLVETAQAALVAGKVPPEAQDKLLKTLDLMEQAAQEDDRKAW